jgi:hypothetical protein
MSFLGMMLQMMLLPICHNSFIGCHPRNMRKQFNLYDSHDRLTVQNSTKNTHYSASNRHEILREKTMDGAMICSTEHKEAWLHQEHPSFYQTNFHGNWQENLKLLQYCMRKNLKLSICC